MKLFLATKPPNWAQAFSAKTWLINDVFPARYSVVAQGIPNADAAKQVNVQLVPKQQHAGKLTRTQSAHAFLIKQLAEVAFVNAYGPIAVQAKAAQVLPACNM